MKNRRPSPSRPLLAREIDDAGHVIAWNTFTAAGLALRCTNSGASAHDGGASTAYIPDPQGNVAVRVDVGTGGVVTQDLYKPYGTQQHGDLTDPIVFGGQYGYLRDPGSGLYQLGYRFYDPSRGRFLTRDPIGYGGGSNLYAYVGGNPINHVDPLGLWDPRDTLDSLLVDLGVPH